ncbi:MAG: hypothetical protein M1826_002706 [Phylliscum demangeonii]|nr:MAG: hypothetical protein M1826_002706 [Phylliscum demangeonii]
MASDEIVWQVINHQFCAYKLKTTKDRTFCRNEYNVTGLCLRQACPLANSRYATVRADPESSTLYLYIKVVERAHLPSKLWERVTLSSNYKTALQQIDEQLIYWPKFLLHKCKQRLTRLTQVAIRARKLAKEEERLGEKIVPRLGPKIRRREDTRERKAEAAAKVERAIERELIERLRSGAYGDKPLNVEEGIWKKVLRGLERTGEGRTDQDSEEEDEVEEELEEEGVGAVEYVSDLEEEDEDDLEDLQSLLDAGGDSENLEEEDSEGDEDVSEDGSDANDGDETDKNETARGKTAASLKRKREHQALPLPGRKKAGTKKIEVEYEYEDEPRPQLVAVAH